MLELFTLLAEARQQVNLSRQLSMQRRPADAADDPTRRPSLNPAPPPAPAPHGVAAEAEHPVPRPGGRSHAALLSLSSFEVAVGGDGTPSDAATSAYREMRMLRNNSL